MIPDYKNESLSFEQRARDLVSRMTLEEKVSQMLHNAPAVERLGIPAYNWWNESLHGVARAGVSTMLPQPIGIAAAFDEELLHHAADMISTEARAKHHEFLRQGDRGGYKGLNFFAPNINIFRDPRWGRGHETYGEDPFLTGRLGTAYIRGMQGNDDRYLKTAACAKHYAVHSGPEEDRHKFESVVSQKDLRETYLPAFRDCVKEGRVASVMGAYNMVNGQPCCGSQLLLEQILREEWKFDGFVVSDCGAVNDFHLYHGVTKTPVESAAMAVKNGCDLECGKMYGNILIAFQDGLISEQAIDTAVFRLMMTRMKLGMFDDSGSVPYAGIPYEVNDSREHREFALEVSKKSLVLLKNKNGMLPLNKDRLKNIAVIGPNADSRTALMGNYFGTASEYVTVLDGIREAVGSGTRVYYAEGCHLYRDRMRGTPGDTLSEAVSAAQRADAVILCLGLDSSIEGEAGDASNEYASGDKPHLDFPGLQQELLEKIVKTGVPVVLVILSGSALAVTWADAHVDAIVQGWYPGAQGGRAIASLLFGEYSPGARLPVSFYVTAGELPDFTDYAMKNRTYRYMEKEALYPFGFGLSYTTFEYSSFHLSRAELAAGQDLECSVKVKNTGSRSGDEVVQLYIKDVVASVTVPRWQLCGFKKVYLQPGEQQEVCFKVTARQMALIAEDGSCLLEPGRFELYAGGSQPDGRSFALTGSKCLKAVFEVFGTVQVVEY
ncbi:MAG TPA: glycosyl hydrolase [Clostridiales bacterium]|nr:glycosyl hydrolase [Clostridiales bacterium]